MSENTRVDCAVSPKKPTHYDHKFHELKRSNLSNDPDHAYTLHPSCLSHETRVRPERESLQPSRRLIQLVNRDEVFVTAKRVLGIFPQVSYKLIKAGGVDRARMVTAFIVSLFEAEYFTVDTKGHYDPSIPGNQERARNMLMGIVYGKKPIYLSYAGKYFFQQYPEMRELFRGNGDAMA